MNNVGDTNELISCTYLFLFSGGTGNEDPDARTKNL